jgi:hypothetical protein
MQLLVDLPIINGHAVAERGAEAGPQGEQQRVVLQRRTLLGVDRLGLAVEPLERVLDQVNAEVSGDLRDLVGLRHAVAERLAHPHRTVREVRLGG